MLLHAGSSTAQVTVTANQTALSLAQKLAGPHVTILNPSLTCDPNAAGLFHITSAAMALDSGIVLTNGNIYALGGYAGTNASTNNGTPGDPQLAQLAGSTTYDACKLEFDVIPKGDSLRFDYVFGSEEYNNAGCGNYNDAFSFFISGPGITGAANMALVPGTTIPVAVNSINNGIPGSQGNIANCHSMGAGSPFTQYYIDNSGGQELTYRGFTKVLQASHAVLPCSTYHLKLTIADAGNALYDSGVFLKAGSLNTNVFSMTASIGGIATDTPVTAKGCPPVIVTIKRRSIKPGPQTLKLAFGGDGVDGLDYTFLADSVVIPASDSQVQVSVNALTLQPGGPKTVLLKLLSPYVCAGTEVLDSVLITLADAPALQILTQDTSVCKGSSFGLRVGGSNGLSYIWSPASGIQTPAVMMPVVSPTSDITYLVTGTLPHSGCAAVHDSIHILVKAPPVVSAGADREVCSGGSVLLTGSVSPAAGSYVLSWSGPNNFSDPDTAITISNAGVANSGTYFFSASDGVCTRTDAVVLTVHPIPPAPAVITPFLICLHGSMVPLRASGNDLLWYNTPTGGTGSTVPFQPSTADTGHFQYYVSQTIDGCESSRSSIEAIVEKCCGDELVIPSAFSPNNDGHNDYFGMQGAAANVSYTFRVFNRWGEQVFHGIRGDRWDGTVHGAQAATGVYFYDLLINCGNGNTLERKGDVLLLR